MSSKNEVAQHGFDISVKAQQEKVKDFEDVLESLTSLESKKKILWKHIYENALEDRTNAYILFMELYTTTQGKATEHQLNGAIFAKYIERMSRANDQILKLAELIQKAQEEEQQISEDDIYNRIHQS